MIRLSNKGFTLIELLVVISIISVLSAVALVSFSNARTKAYVSVTKSQLRQFQIAFESYFNDKNDYPPFGQDFCSVCYDHHWVDVITELMPYLSARSDVDAWGRAFYYDKNYQQGCWNAWSVMCSAGPNGIVETNICQTAGVTGGDDICIFLPDND